MQNMLLKSEPLYMQLKRKLRTLIDKETLTMLPREKDLEKRFGVSRITVRKAIQELTTDGIVTPVQGRGTMVSKHIPAPCRELGITAGSTGWHVENLFSAAIEEAKRLKYNMNTFVLNMFDENVAIPSSGTLFSHLIASGKLNGLLLSGGKLPELSVEYLIKKKTPMVISGIKYKKFDIPCVRLEFERPIEEMTEKLMAAGFRKLAFIAIRDSREEEDNAIGDFYYFKKSYHHIIKKYGLQEYHFPESGKDTVASAMERLYSLPSKERPNVLSVRFHRDSLLVKDFLDAQKDWNPLFIASNKDSDAVISSNYTDIIKLSLQTLVEIIENPGKKMEDRTLPIEIVFSENAFKKQRR